MRTWKAYWHAVLTWTVAFAALLVLFRMSIVFTGPPGRLWHDAALIVATLPTYAALVLAFAALAGGVAASRTLDGPNTGSARLWPVLAAAVATVALSYGLDAYLSPVSGFVIGVHVLGKNAAEMFPGGPETPGRLLAMISAAASDPSSTPVPVEILRFRMAQGMVGALLVLPHTLVGVLLGLLVRRNMSWHALTLSAWGFASLLLLCHVQAAKLGRALLDTGAPPLLSASVPLVIPLIVLVVLRWAWWISRQSYAFPFELDG